MSLNTILFHLSSVLNVEEISFDQRADPFTFKSQRDHSKWAVSDDDSTSSVNWICVGDINRAEHQKERGGGTVCLNSTKIAGSYKKLIKLTEPCTRIYLLTK